MFRNRILDSFVPRQREARLYSRSRYMKTRLRTLRAVASQPKPIMAMPMVTMDLPTIRAIRVM